VIPELKKHHELIEDYKKADKLVVWCESKRNGWADRIEYAQKKGKEVILYQQGIWAFDWVRPPFSEPIISDTLCVWGEEDKRRLIKYGTPAEKIKVTGSPLIKHLKPRVPHEGKNVVFALEHWNVREDVPENLIVASELRKLEGVKVWTKGLFNENQTRIFQNPIETDRFNPNHLQQVAEVLSTADLVVGITESTFQFLAECLDIPVIIADIWIPRERGGDKRYLDFYPNFSNGVTKVPLKDLNKEIYKQLKHPEIKREERKQSAIDNGGINLPDPVKTLVDIIENDLPNIKRVRKSKKTT
jgi:hypothetical protein